MRERVLITGASGFVGACLTEDMVKEGYDIAVVTRNIDLAWRLNKIKNDVKVYNINLCDENSVNHMILDFKPVKVFNLATYGGYYYQKDDNKILSNNIFSSFNMINAALKINFDSFINIGSSSEYGTKSQPMKETDLLEPVNTYGISKAASTMLCRMTALNTKLPIATVRLFSPFGYYEDKSRLVSSVILSCINNENPKLASGDAVRDFIFIEDVIEMIKKVSITPNICGKIYNCGTGKQVSVREMVETIIKVSNKNLSPNWGKVDDRKSDTDKWQADMSYVKQKLDWKPKYSLTDAILKDYEWFLNNLRLYRGI